MKEFSSKFATIGNVPFKEKERVQKAYKAALDKAYDSVDMDAAEKAAIMFESKLESIENSDNHEYLLGNEREFIRKKISRLNDEINKVETNMSFFANADENNPLLKSANEGLARSKAELVGLKEQLKMIRILENKLNKPVEVEEDVAESAENKEEENE